MSPGGFFLLGSRIKGGSIVSEFKSEEGVPPVNHPVLQSPTSMSLKSSPNVKSSRWKSNEGLLIRLNKKTNKLGHYLTFNTSGSIHLHSEMGMGKRMSSKETNVPHGPIIYLEKQFLLWKMFEK